MTIAAPGVPLPESDAAHLVEESEARAYSELVNGAATDVNQRFEISVHRVGSAHAFVAAGLRDSLILNRVIGLGVAASATEQDFAELDDTYLSRGVSTYAIEVSPASLPPDLLSHVASRGFIPYKKTAMLYRAVQSVPPHECALRVEGVGSDHAKIFSDLLCEVFQLGDPFPGLLTGTFRSPRWQNFLAFEGDKPVAAGMTYVADDVAWIGWVGTLAQYRGRGAQGSITAAQLRAAAAGRVRWVTLEVAPGTERRPSQTFRNYQRFGWTMAYNRITCVRRADVGSMR
jgi:hypothetical protein